MKDFALEYSLNVVIALVILALGQFVVEQGKDFYYTYTPTSTFYDRGTLTAFDVCVGDENQSLLSTRSVLKTEQGYKAEVTKELFRIDGTTEVKVYEEFTRPYVEASSNGQAQRIQHLPTNLSVGQYQWIFFITLEVSGIGKEVAPPVESNVFSIKDC